jgi:hypothetical protein
MNAAPQADNTETTKITVLKTRTSWGDEGAESTVIIAVRYSRKGRRVWKTCAVKLSQSDGFHSSNLKLGWVSWTWNTRTCSYSRTRKRRVSSLSSPWENITPKRRNTETAHVDFRWWVAAAISNSTFRTPVHVLRWRCLQRSPAYLWIPSEQKQYRVSDFLGLKLLIFESSNFWRGFRRKGVDISHLARSSRGNAWHGQSII